ncbi:hypothetical protein AB0K12_33465 [Nonomuraea sp. NPDC049419]|uniref:hypothetical protein n=1 Tax=Nonomuraea sp. NPDC049419 TaxID=3155772 RepID=UPI003422930E
MDGDPLTMTDQQPWQWDERTWRGHVGRVRAGRGLGPASWPGGARAGIAAYVWEHA